MPDNLNYRQQRAVWARWPNWMDYLVVILLEAGLTAGLLALMPVVEIGWFPIAYVLLSMVVAYFFGTGPAIVAVILGWLAFTHFFVGPVGLWPIARTRSDWARHIAFLLGVITISIAAVQARKSQHRVQQLADEAGQLNASLRDEMSEREKATRELREHAATLQEQAHMLDLAHILIRDMDNRVIFWNRGAEALYGWSRDEALGKTTDELFHTVFPRPVEDIKAQVLRDGEWQGELVHTRRDGSTIILASHWVLHRDQDGAPRAFIEVNNDITDLKRAEQALRVSEERYRSLIDISPVAILLNRGNHFVFVNQAAVELFRASSPDELIGKSPFDLFHPDYHERVRARIEQQLQGRRAPLMEEDIICMDGTVRTVEVAATPITDEQGTAIQVIMHDVTDRKQAEQETRRLNAELEQRVAERTAQLDTALKQEQVARADAYAAEAKTKSWLELAPDGIIIVNADGVIAFANGQAISMFGYETGELLGKPIESLIPERYRGVHVGHRGDYAVDPRTRPMGAGLELFGLRKDGSEFPVEIALSPSWTDDELNVTAIIRDITQRRRAQNEISMLNESLQKRALQLEVSNRELEAFSYSVSHDLRAPLRAIDGFSNALLKHYPDVLDDRGKDYLHRVRAAAQRMAQLIDDILGLSRASRVEMHRQEVDLSALATEVLDELRKSQPHRKAEIFVAPDMTVSADAHLLRIAMDNLLGNAWKFTGMRDPACIEVGAIEREGERVYYVKDNGAGFDPEYAGKLFSPFQRLHAESEFPGTGIGLALVQRIIRRHGGRIWAESGIDKGATFYFTLGAAQE